MSKDDTPGDCIHPVSKADNVSIFSRNSLFTIPEPPPEAHKRAKSEPPRCMHSALHRIVLSSRVFNATTPCKPCIGSGDLCRFEIRRDWRPVEGWCVPCRDLNNETCDATYVAELSRRIPAAPSASNGWLDTRPAMHRDFELSAANASRDLFDDKQEAVIGHRPPTAPIKKTPTKGGWGNGVFVMVSFRSKAKRDEGCGEGGDLEKEKAAAVGGTEVFIRGGGKNENEIRGESSVESIIRDDSERGKSEARIVVEETANVGEEKEQKAETTDGARDVSKGEGEEEPEVPTTIGTNSAARKREQKRRR